MSMSTLRWQHHGAAVRDDLAWDEYWRWETEDMTAAIYYNEKHRPLGYVAYSIENEHFNIKELVYLNQEARHGPVELHLGALLDDHRCTGLQLHRRTAGLPAGGQRDPGDHRTQCDGPDY